MNDFEIGEKIYFTDVVGRRSDRPGASTMYNKKVPYNCGVVIGKKRIAGRPGGAICAPVSQGWAWIVALYNQDSKPSMYKRVEVFDTSAYSVADWLNKAKKDSVLSASTVSVPVQVQVVIQGVSKMFDLKSAVEAKCDELVKAGTAFTAYDVTKQVRSDNQGQDVPHYTLGQIQGVRELVRDYMASVPGYDGSVESVPGGNAAVMYRPLSTVAQLAP